MGNIESVRPVPCHVKEQNFSSGPQGSQLTDDKIEGNFSSSFREDHFEANGNNSYTHQAEAGMAQVVSVK